MDIDQSFNEAPESCFTAARHFKHWAVANHISLEKRSVWQPWWACFYEGWLRGAFAGQNLSEDTENYLKGMRQ